MPLGVEIRTRTAPPARGAPTTTDTLFVAAQVTSGSTTKAVEVRSLVDFTAEYGVRAAGNQVVYDGLDTFFREGGRRAYVARYTTTNLANALALFDEGLGAGQVVAWNETPGAATYGALLTHAAATNRFALLDVDNDDTIAEMTTLAGVIPGANQEYGMIAGQWVNIPGPAGVIGASTRQVHGSAVTAALIARADALGNPNRAAAGRDFPLQYVTSLVRSVNLADTDTLLNAGANVFMDRYGVLQLYGFQTGVDQNIDNPFWQANCVRARMWIVAHAKSVGENYMFRPIDGRGLLSRSLKTDLDAVLLQLYNANGLYGDTPAAAFSTEVGASVNTESAVAQGELHAVAEARFSLHAKSVLIDLVAVPVTGRVTTPA